MNRIADLIVFYLSCARLGTVITLDDVCKNKIYSLELILIDFKQIGHDGRALKTLHH